MIFEIWMFYIVNDEWTSYKKVDKKLSGILCLI